MECRDKDSVMIANSFRSCDSFRTRKLALFKLDVLADGFFFACFALPWFVHGLTTMTNNNIKSNCDDNENNLSITEYGSASRSESSESEGTLGNFVNKSATTSSASTASGGSVEDPAARQVEVRRVSRSAKRRERRRKLKMHRRAEGHSMNNKSVIVNGHFILNL